MLAGLDQEQGLEQDLDELKQKIHAIPGPGRRSSAELAHERLGKNRKNKGGKVGSSNKDHMTQLHRLTSSVGERRHEGQVDQSRENSTSAGMDLSKQQSGQKQKHKGKMIHQTHIQQNEGSQPSGLGNQHWKRGLPWRWRHLTLPCKYVLSKNYDVELTRGRL